MEQKTVREWKSIVCPDGKAPSMVMFEWDILSEEDRIVKKTLRQMDCHNRRLTEFGGRDCSWECQKTVADEGMTKSRMELFWVCAIFLSGILWIFFYDVHLKPFLHLYGLIVFFGLPFLIILMFFYTWKMMRHIFTSNTDPSNLQMKKK
jgi:hypothetical protein